MISLEAIVAEARTWIGTPYAHQQYAKGLGCDCVGLLIGIAYELGIADARAHPYRGYGRMPYGGTLLRACEQYLERLPRAQAKPGDVVLLRFEREPQHVALISRADPYYVVHAHASVGRVVENGLDVMRDPRIVQAFRFRGVACN